MSISFKTAPNHECCSMQIEPLMSTASTWMLQPHSRPVMIHLKPDAWRKIPEHKISRSDVSIQLSQPSFNLWLAVENSCEESLKRENMQNDASYGVSSDGLRHIFPFIARKKSQIGKLCELKLFRSPFFSGSSDLINRSLQWDFSLPLIYFFQSVCTAATMNGKMKIFFVGGKLLETIWETLCDLYANVEGRPWITWQLNLIIKFCRLEKRWKEGQEMNNKVLKWLIKVSCKKLF